MNFEISRITDPDLESLFQRPRVSHKISEYVLSYIDEKILKPNRILQSDKQVYWFTPSFSFTIRKPNRILYKSPFSTEARLYVPHKGFRKVEGKKWAFLSVIADDINQDIGPCEYALVVFDMFADYLTYNYKKLTKQFLILSATKWMRHTFEVSSIPLRLKSNNTHWTKAGMDLNRLALAKVGRTA